MSLPLDHDHRDSILAALLEQAAEAARSGQTPDLEALVRPYPDLAGELRQLWAMVQITEGVADGVRQYSSPSSPQTKPAGPEKSDSRATAVFPRAFGEYELLRELGRGGMGVVFAARQTQLGRTVALKKLLRDQDASASDLARFRSEVLVAAKLDHPGIVPLYDVGEIDGQPFFTMKLVSGTTLAQRLASGPLPPREAAQWLLDVTLAVAFAHQQGVLHRDLKPSNILLDEEGRPHVSDFGLAKRVSGGESLTCTGAVLGTPSYMAPEQAAGGRGDVGPATDVYALGAILYQALTGRPPFQAQTPLDTVLLVLEQDPLPPRLLNPLADPDLELIALRCLQKLPSLRYASATELAQDLRAYLAGETISARSGAFRQVLGRLFRETHHATVLLNWGKLWMLHSAALLLVCLATNALKLAGVSHVWPYLGLWILALGTWAGVFWGLRRRAGPVTFVERQIAHVWAASMLSIALLFPVERLMGLPVLTLSPVLGLVSGSVFVAKAGILSGRFYLEAAACFAMAPVMALCPDYGITIFGVVSWACFFFSGLKYYRQRLAENHS